MFTLTIHVAPAHSVTRVVRANTGNLLVLGGYSWDSGPPVVAVSTVHIIDSTTYSITVSDGSLDIPLAPTGAVAVDGVAYAFGGMTLSFTMLSSWRFLDLSFRFYIAFVWLLRFEHVHSPQHCRSIPRTHISSYH